MATPTDSLDPLTSLPTYTALDHAIALANAPIAAVFLDIDGFRFLNHEHGHVAGDDVLLRLATWLADHAQTLRGQTFRVAGDKFILLLPDRTLAEAAETATTIVAAVPSLPLPHPITLSAVVFPLDPARHVHVRDLLEELTEKLYRAELTSGRNHSNVVISGAFTPPGGTTSS